MGAAPNQRALRAVREQRRLDVAEVAAFTSIAPDRLVAFEEGDRTPSRKQMQRLADTYGVALYSLFSDSIPNLPPLPQDFRQAEPTPADLTPRGIKTLLTSEQISHFTRQLALALDYEPSAVTQPAMIETRFKMRAEALRRAFDIWFEHRKSALDLTGLPEQQFMSALRLFLEVQGLVVNINDAPPDDYMGFFIRPDVGMPTIFVNRTVSSKKAQLFTLAHEYAHALLGEYGISNPFMPRNAVERQCNIFAAEFLAPIAAFATTVEALPRNTRTDVLELINAASAASLLSKHAAAIRLVEGGYINRSQFSTWRRLFTASPRSEKDEEKELATNASGGVPHAKRLSEIGHLPVVLAKYALDRRLIDPTDVEEGIGLSQTLQERAFSLADRRFRIAYS